MRTGFAVGGGTIGKSLTASLALILAGLLAVPEALAAGKVIPWAFGGYESIEDIHLVYWSASKDAADSSEKIVAPGFRTELHELWYGKAPQSYRVDRYEEMGTLKCNEFKGVKWETRAQDGRSYFLSERIVQNGMNRTAFRLENILSSTSGRQLCEYKKFSSAKKPPASVKDVLGHLTLRPYIATPEIEEMASMSLEMDQAMNPDAYRQTVKELGKNYDKAGRKTAKWNTNHGMRSYLGNGYVFVDLQWGIGLEGYLTEIRETGKKAVRLGDPVCIYRVLGLDTKKADAAVFSIWQK